jgi:hypothetical protein
MSNTYAMKLAAAILKSKLAAGKMPAEAEAAHEAAESPAQEKLEHQPGQYEEGGEGLEGAAESQGHEAAEAPAQEELEHAMAGAGEGTEEDHIDQLLSQLSPEELDQLAAELSGEMQAAPGMEGQGAGGEDVGELAQAIQEHLAQNPEAAVAGATPEKAAALDFVKSASYIEGFLNQAIDRGVSVKQAVDMYDQALTTTINTMKSAELKGNQTKLDVDKDGKIEASDLKKLRAGKTHSSDDEVKTAAYYEGIIERAREYGFSDHEAIQFVKSAAPKDMLDKARQLGRIAGKKTSRAAKDVRDKAKDYVKNNPGKSTAGAGAALVGGGYLAAKSVGKDKE